MFDLAAELRQLAIAERHLTEGDQRVHRLEAMIVTATDRGQIVSRSVELLATMKETMLLLQAHADLIRQTIDDLSRERCDGSGH